MIEQLKEALAHAMDMLFNTAAESFPTFILVTINAKEQAGADAKLITSNLTLIFGAMLPAFGISYRFSSKNNKSNILSAFYRREKSNRGMTIKVDDTEGVLAEIDSLSVTLDCGDKSAELPTELLISNK